MHSFTVFPWRAGLGLQELGGLQCRWNLLASRENVICTYERIVPPACTGPCFSVSEEQPHSFSALGEWEGKSEQMRQICKVQMQQETAGLSVKYNKQFSAAAVVRLSVHEFPVTVSVLDLGAGCQ